MPLEYTPKQPQQQKAPAPTYELKRDVTGKPKARPTPMVIKDMLGRDIHVPHAPKASCNKCRGKGYIGLDAKSNKTIVCGKCYPKM